MLTPRFDTLFTGLLRAFVRYQEVPRHPDHATELAAARWHLHLARMAVAAERERIMTADQAPGRRTAVAGEAQARLRVNGIGLTP